MKPNIKNTLFRENGQLMEDIFKKIVELEESGINGILCTVIQTKGSTPLKAGAKMIVASNGKTYGTVGGGRVESETIDKAKKLLNTYNTEIFHIELINKGEPSCGGIVDIFMEPISNQYRLYIFGGGHVGKALASYVEHLDFDITVIDNREGIFDDWTEGNYKRVVTQMDDFLTTMNFDERTFITIITYDHKLDWEILSYCINQNWGYLGMMGSKSKIKEMKKKLTNLGINDDLINKINMPIGIDINAYSASEIAISITSKLIQEKNKKNK